MIYTQMYYLKTVITTNKGPCGAVDSRLESPTKISNFCGARYGNDEVGGRGPIRE